MPIAIRSTEEQRFDLKTCPEGYVILRRMSYGQILERRAIMKLTFSGSRKTKELAGEMAMADKKVQLFEFRSCIVEHNLYRDENNLLNLSNPVDIESLDPRIGQEIEKLIEDMNNFDEDDDDNPNSSGE